MTATATTYHREIEETCAIADRPHRAAAFIDAGRTPAEVRKELLSEVSLADRMRVDHGLRPEAASANGHSAAGSLAQRMRDTYGAHDGPDAPHNGQPAHASLTDRMRARFGRREP